MTGVKKTTPVEQRRKMQYARLIARTKKASATGCLECQANLQKNGYALVKVGINKREYAHRFVWSVLHGPIPQGVDVLHACDNPRCINPAHLHLGNDQLNMREMTLRGRGKPNGRPQKLDAAKVLEIRERYKLGNVTQKLLAKEHGVTAPYISQLIQGKCWNFL